MWNNYDHANTSCLPCVLPGAWKGPLLADKFPVVCVVLLGIFYIANMPADVTISDSTYDPITVDKDDHGGKEVRRSSKKRKEDGAAKKPSKRKKERQSGPMAKKRKVESDATSPLVVPEGDEEAMQTRMRTGTISKVRLAIFINDETLVGLGKLLFKAGQVVRRKFG